MDEREEKDHEVRDVAGVGKVQTRNIA